MFLLLKSQITPLHIQMPFQNLQKGLWASVVVNVKDMIETCFAPCVYHSIDFILVNPVCKLQKILTMLTPSEACSVIDFVRSQSTFKVGPCIFCDRTRIESKVVELVF